jgi:hypothetical protein
MPLRGLLTAIFGFSAAVAITVLKIRLRAWVNLRKTRDVKEVIRPIRNCRLPISDFTMFIITPPYKLWIIYKLGCREAEKP